MTKTTTKTTGTTELTGEVQRRYEMTQLRIIGDVHGHIDDYEKLLGRSEGCEYSLQIGDMGFHYAFDQDPERHKFFGGNHDNYDVIDASPNNLGNFGVWEVPNFGPVFWVRGGFSIDHSIRRKHDTYTMPLMYVKSWWEEEEMSYAQCGDALELYKEVKPKMLVSHECPVNIVQFVSNPKFVLDWGYDDPVIKTKTNQLLQAMTDFHRPRLHVFGHFHRTFDAYIDGVSVGFMPENCPEEDRQYFTRYICVDILKTLDLPENYVQTL